MPRFSEKIAGSARGHWRPLRQAQDLEPVETVARVGRGFSKGVPVSKRAGRPFPLCGADPHAGAKDTGHGSCMTYRSPSSFYENL